MIKVPAMARLKFTAHQRSARLGCALLVMHLAVLSACTSGPSAPDDSSYAQELEDERAARDHAYRTSDELLADHQDHGHGKSNQPGNAKLLRDGRQPAFTRKTGEGSPQIEKRVSGGTAPGALHVAESQCIADIPVEIGHIGK